MSPKSNFDLKWYESVKSAFIESKQILANATLLVHPNHSALLNITCDASDSAVGGVLQQYIDNVWRPLSFFSKKLTPAETRYSEFDQELLAVSATTRHFRHNLEGRFFFVNTDHKPLTFIMSRVIVSIVGSFRDREVACSASDRQGSNFESCVWRTVSSQSSHHPQEVLLAEFSLYVHKGGLKPDSFHFH